MESEMSIRGGPTQSAEGRSFHFKSLLQKAGWITPAFVDVDGRGFILRISDKPSGNAVAGEWVNGYAVPGFQNAHSHAFQFAMAGMAEKHHEDAIDDFWRWREAMYACALTLEPDQMQAVAAMLYTEMLKRGYTHVAEFQYLHHDKKGQPYENLAEMSVCLVAAAAIAGIRITLVPVFYKTGGFGREAEPAQRRFCFRSTDQYFRLLEECKNIVKQVTTANIGFGVHSLRAADTHDIMRITAEGPPHLPFHLHAGEQLREVNDALAFLRQRPVEWVLTHLPVDERFHLIHCTHLSDQEVSALGKSGAHVVLCPGTEANLGDGIFRLNDFARHSDHWSIGTDSHISLNPLEDLRWLDYVQRLTTHRRNTFADGASRLMNSTFFSGKKAMGISAREYFEVGQPLDAVVYDGNSPLLNTAEAEHLLPTLVYTADSASVSGTLVNGQWIVSRQHHLHEEEILKGFQQAIKNIARK